MNRCQLFDRERLAPYVRCYARCRHEELRFRLWLYDPSRRRHVEPPAAISRSATTVGALTIALAFDWAELLVAFAHDPPETLYPTARCIPGGMPRAMAAPRMGIHYHA